MQKISKWEIARLQRQSAPRLNPRPCQARPSTCDVADVSDLPTGHPYSTAPAACRRVGAAALRDYGRRREPAPRRAAARGCQRLRAITGGGRTASRTHATCSASRPPRRRAARASSARPSAASSPRPSKRAGRAASASSRTSTGSRAGQHARPSALQAPAPSAAPAAHARDRGEHTGSEGAAGWHQRTGLRARRTPAPPPRGAHRRRRRHPAERASRGGAAGACSIDTSCETRARPGRVRVGSEGVGYSARSAPARSWRFCPPATGARRDRRSHLAETS